MSDHEELPARAGAADLTVRFPGIPEVHEIDCSDQAMFRGKVRTRTARQAQTTGELTVMATTFDAGASTVWHTHESDQTLVLVSGSGALEDDDGVHSLRTGDVVTVPGGRRHRHLSAAERPMTHLSITAHGNHHVATGG